MNHRKEIQPCPLDSLPGQRCGDAILMLQFLRRNPLDFVVVGSPAGNATADLSRCGLVDLEFDDAEIVAVYRILRIAGVR